MANKLINVTSNENTVYPNSAICKPDLIYVSTQAALDDALSDSGLGDQMHYFRTVNVNAALSFDGGVWLVEGYKVNSDYGWQTVKKYTSNAGIISKSRSKQHGVWGDWA